MSLRQEQAWFPLEFAQGEKLGALQLVWPIKSPDALFSASAGESDTSIDAEEAADQPDQESSSDETSGDSESTSDSTKSRSHVLKWMQANPQDYRDLPPNTRSMLQVMVSVSVTLAHKKHHVRDIIALGPGSILTFDKQCDGPIDLEVDGVRIAEGDPVKVGEKFGYRVREMVMPDEHFSPMYSTKPAAG